MRIRNLFGIVLMVVLVAALTATAETQFVATLTGAQEIPPNASAAIGFGTFTLNSAGDSLSFSVHWRNLSGAFTASHFHHAPPGVAGPIVFSLVPFVQGDSMAVGVWSIPDSNRVELLAGNLYVNVHTQTFPAGEIRGQVVQAPDTATFETDEIGRSYCIHLTSDSTMPALIRLIGVGAGQVPVVTIRLGCLFNGVPCDTVNDEGGPIDTNCVAATFYTLGTEWSFADSAFTRAITGNGCVCVTLESILPVEFVHLGADVQGGTVTLHWNTASESNLNYYEVSRTVTGHNQAVMLGHVNATNAPTGAAYQFVDESAVADVPYTYTLSVVDMNGSSTVLASVNATPGTAASVITNYALYANYPNPFNPSTLINFDLKEGGLVKLGVFDLLGRHVADVVDGAMAAGRHSISFAGANLPSGIYVYRIDVNGFHDQKKMVLLK